MRPLIFFIIISLSSFIHAFEVSTSYSSLKKRYGTPDNHTWKNIEQADLTLKSNHSLSQFTIDWESTLTAPSYDSYTIRLQDGREKKLSSLLGDAQKELFSQASLSYTKNESTLKMTALTHLTATPFRKNGFEFNLGRAFHSGLDQISLSYLRLWQKMPEDYFINENYQNQKRATQLKGQSIKFRYDLALSEKMKSMITLLAEEKEGDRPWHYGIETRLSRGITNQLFLQTLFRYLNEPQDKTLYDERGFFQALTIGGEIVWEPVFELLLSAGYALTRETEEDPRQGSQYQTGTDTYSLGVSWPQSFGRLQVSTSYSASNTNEKNFNLRLAQSFGL